MYNWLIHSFILTSAHSVDPSRPNSSASQLAKITVLLGLQPQLQLKRDLNREWGLNTVREGHDSVCVCGHTSAHEFSSCSHSLMHQSSSWHRINPSKHPCIPMTAQNDVPVWSHANKHTDTITKLATVFLGIRVIYWCSWWFECLGYSAR